ncbi:MAG: trigger factor [Gemmatimonadota bacterium]|nr:trigger factor [Gemmatimonadota bacterium]
MDIQITPKKSEGLERIIEVSVAASELLSAEEKAAKRYASQVRLPGFRPGKAPAGMVRKRFAQPIRQEAVEQLLQAAYQEVLEREKISPASQPRVEHVHFDQGKPLTFELHLEVRPTIEVARAAGFRVTKPFHPVTADQVREQLDHLRDERAAWSPVTDKALPGDLVVASLGTSDDSGEMSEGKEYRIVLGSGQALPGIEELIMEVAPGDTAERPVHWPEDFPDEAQRGKTKKVRVTVKEVKRKALPEMDDAFAREVGDFDSIDALTAAVREDLVRHAEREADSQVRNRLMDDIIGANSFDVPPSWVTQMVQAYMEAYKVPEDEQERFKTELRPVAERQVRRDLVIDTLAERESLTATEAEIDDRIGEVAVKRNADPGQVYASLQKAGRLKEIERSITEDKVFAWLLKQNTVENEQ